MDSHAEKGCSFDGKDRQPLVQPLSNALSQPLVQPLVQHPAQTLIHQVPMDSRAEMWCSFDGKDRQPLRAGDAIIIRSSRWPIPTVCSSDPSRDWFMGVREGLHWNSRRVQAGAGQ